MYVRNMAFVCVVHNRQKGASMNKSINLTVRVSPQLKMEAEAAADYLDLSLSQVVRNAFKKIIQDVNEKKARDISFKRQYAEYGIDGPTMTPKQQEEYKLHGVDTRNLSRQQRRALERGIRSGKISQQRDFRIRSDAEIALESKQLKARIEEHTKR